MLVIRPVHLTRALLLSALWAMVCATVLPAPLALAQNTSTAPDPTAHSPASDPDDKDDSGAVFTLGPTPFLPPKSWSEESEETKAVPPSAPTVNPAPAAVPAPTVTPAPVALPAPAAPPVPDVLPTPEPETEPELPATVPVRPIMEQVDVTAKRLPPQPKPVSEPVKPGFTVSSAPPPGFEDLAGAQTTLVDVVYSKRVIVSTMATLDMGLLEFANPEEVVLALPGVTDISVVVDALTGPLDTHANALCYSDFDTDCGLLTPEIADIIYDEDRFRATLFVNPAYLETQFLADSGFLPRSDSGPASVHAFSLSANGDSLNRNINLSANSLVSYRETRLETQYDVGSRGGLSFDTLTLKHDARGWEFETGAFRSRIQSAGFLTEQNLIGARVSTSLNTRTDLRYAEATPLFAFLEQRSRVDILRGNQLLDSRFYEAGNQQLDTSRLPDGAYTVTVRINGNSSDRQSTEYYFARTSALPPKDQPLYFAEAGELALTREGVLPQFADSHWLRVGTAHRLRDDFGLEGTLSSIGDSTLVEGGLVWFQPGLQLQATLLAGDSTGFSLRSLWQRDRFSFSADIRRIAAEQAVQAGSLELLPQTYTQANLTASLPLFEGRMLAQARVDRRGTRDFKSLGFNYQREFRRFAKSAMSFNIDTTFSSDDSIVRLGVDWRWRGDNRDASVQPRLQYSANNGSDALLNARYTKTLRNDSEGLYRVNAYVDRAVGQSAIGTRFSAEQSRGVGEAELQYGFDGERTGLAYIANARFGVVSSGREVALGGRRAATSSIIVNIEGNAPSAVFEVMVGKQSQGYAKSGSSTLIALPPYETYDIRLISRDGEFVEFDETTQSVTLYPGNVKTLTFTARRQVVVVGRAVDASGNAVANHTFTNLDGFASTDENGWFQIELTEAAPLTLKRGDDSTCTINLPPDQGEDSLIVVDDVMCR